MRSHGSFVSSRCSAGLWSICPWYDAAGNRTAYTETITGTLVTTYTYDAANRLTWVNEVEYTYDNRGNLTHDGVFTYTWNAAGRLVQAESVTHTLVYTYNGDGVRVASAADGIETRYVQDVVGLPQVLVETTGGQTTLYVYGMMRLAQVQGAEVEWFLGNALGSVRQLVDDDGVVLLARDYDPYGQLLSESGTGSSGYGFTGEQYDRYTQFVFLRARWLDLSIGQFLSRDLVQGNHPYLYVGGNPLNYTDPTGLWRWRRTPSIYHRPIEDYYERFPLNLERQLEYPIPLTPFRHPDMFNSTTGDVYEIEPWLTRQLGVAQVKGYVADLVNAAGHSQLTGSFPGGPPYDWNNTPFHVGLRADWPGKYRGILLGFPMVDLVADYVGQGVVIFWLEPNALALVPFVVPFKDLVRPKNWVPRLQPAPQPAYMLSWSELCGYTIVVVGGLITAVTVVEDIATLGLGTFDDVVTVPAGLLFIDAGQRLAVLVPTAP